MKIVDRQTFLCLPAGTVFAKFGKQPKDGSHVNLTYGEVAIKGETVHGDFVVQDLFPWFVGTDDSDQWMSTLIAMIDGEESPPLDYECDGRDGLFDEDQLFAAWNRDDLLRLIVRLNKALIDGYES